MSVTLRGILSSAWNTFLHINPVTGGYFLGKRIAESEMVRDTVKVTSDNAKKAAQAVKETTNAVLDYPIDQGVKKVVIKTSEAIETGAKAVKDTVESGAQAVVDGVEAGVQAVSDGVEAGIQAVDEAQEEVRRDVAEWIAPEDAPTTPNPEPVAPPPAAPAAKELVAAPKTPAETKAFQEKFNAWLASADGEQARTSGVAPLSVDSVYGPLTKYALALYNSR